MLDAGRLPDMLECKGKSNFLFVIFLSARRIKVRSVSYEDREVR
jgi:hypothetical protein